MNNIISDALPTSHDVQLTFKLEQFLAKHNALVMSCTDFDHSMIVLKTLYILFNEWIRSCAPEQQKHYINGRLITFGSFRLGVNMPGGDIDVVCIAPRHIRRRDFFVHFADILKKHASVRNLVVIEDAFVPVISMQFDNLDVSLSAC